MDIYNDLIMEHSMNSPYKKEIETNIKQKGHNPSCGDEITLEIVFDGDVILDMAYTGHGCAISQGATSILIETLIGKTKQEAKEIIGLYKKMIKRESLTSDEKQKLEDLIAFENISNMPARVKCALLAPNTLDLILEKIDGEEK